MGFSFHFMLALLVWSISCLDITEGEINKGKAKPMTRWSAGFITDGDRSARFINGIQQTVRELENRGINGTGEVVGLIDSGIDVNLSVFYDNFTEFKYDETNMDHRKIVYYGRHSDGTDFNPGHGTHLAAIMAGQTNAVGGSLYNGVAPEAKIAMLDIGKTETPTVLDETYDKDKIYSYLESIDTGVVVHGWGHNSFNESESRREFDKYAHKYNKSLFIFAAGNDGRKTNVTTPGDSSNVLTVGASEAPPSHGITLSNDITYGDNETSTFFNGTQLPWSKSLWRWSLEDAKTTLNVSYMAYEDFVSSGGDKTRKTVVILMDSTEICEKSTTAEKLGARIIIAVGSDLPTCSENTNVTVIEAKKEDVESFIALKSNTVSVFIEEPVPSSEYQPAADFSSCGSRNTLLMKPEVITSGVLTSFASDGLDSKVRGYDPSQLREFTGTSGAAALVGGAATLIRQYFRSGFYPTGHAVSENGFTPSAMLLKASVIQSAEYQNNESRPDACSGYGQVNLKKVLHFSDDNNKMRVVDNVVIRPHSHISTSVTFTPDGATDFSATLSWYHIPSTETVADVSHIVIMHVITPSGKILFGNKGNVTVDDLISLNQKVFIPAHKVEKGVYTIHIICEKANKEVDTTGAFIINGPIDDTETPSSLTFADDMTCSNSCSSHGTCNNGLCECEEDYYGSVCSVKSMKLHLNELDFFQLDPFEYRTFYLEIPARGPGSYYGFKMGGEHATVMITESPRNSLADSISKFSLIPGYDNTIKMGYAMENISAQYARVFFFSHQNQRGYYRIEPIIDLNVKTPTPSMSPSVSPSATFDEPTAAPTDKSSFVKTPAFIATVSVLGVVVICVGVFLALKWRKPAELSTLHENMV